MKFTYAHEIWGSKWFLLGQNWHIYKNGVNCLLNTNALSPNYHRVNMKKNEICLALFREFESPGMGFCKAKLS